MKPSLGKRAFVPKRLLGPVKARQARLTLKFSERQTSHVERVLAQQEREEYGDGQVAEIGTLVTVNEYKETRDGVSLPRSWAMTNLEGIDWVDKTVFPKHGIKYNGGPQPRDEDQRIFFQSLEREAKRGGPQDILANAATGAGKSVAGIWLGQALKTRTLIIVDQNKLANDWLKNMRKFYGDAWVEANVGRVQQERCEWQDKAFSIGLLQSIVSRDYGPDFYSAFGLTIFDEVQIYGSETYSKALSMFKAKVRVGFTAENRGGAFGRLIKAHLGDTKIVSEQQVMQPTAYLIKNVIDRTFYCMSDGAILNGLAALSDRNAKLAKLIKRRGYDRGRNVLVMSERTAHLVNLYNRCLELGVPADAMGLHMGSYISGRWEVVYTYGTNLLPLAVFETRHEANEAAKALRKGESDLTLPKALQTKMRKDPKSVMFDIRKETYVPSQEELDNITNSCQITFATKQIFSKGVNVPRLDMGVEALPLGNAKQPLGRILRVVDGKKIPEWYSISDVVELGGAFKSASNPSVHLINSFLETKTKSRIKSFKTANAKLVRA